MLEFLNVYVTYRCKPYYSDICDKMGATTKGELGGFATYKFYCL